MGLLAEPRPVLSGHGATDRQGEVHQRFVDPPGGRRFARVCELEQQDSMGIPVAGMADDGRHQAGRGDHPPNPADAIGRAGDRHADVGRDTLDAEPERTGGIKRITADAPEAIGRLGGAGTLDSDGVGVRAGFSNRDRSRETAISAPTNSTRSVGG